MKGENPNSWVGISSTNRIRNSKYDPNVAASKAITGAGSIINEVISDKAIGAYIVNNTGDLLHVSVDGTAAVNTDAPILPGNSMYFPGDDAALNLIFVLPATAGGVGVFIAAQR